MQIPNIQTYFHYLSFFPRLFLSFFLSFLPSFLSSFLLSFFLSCSHARTLLCNLLSNTMPPAQSVTNWANLHSVIVSRFQTSAAALSGDSTMHRLHLLQGVQVCIINCICVFAYMCRRERTYLCAILVLRFFYIFKQVHILITSRIALLSLSLAAFLSRTFFFSLLQFFFLLILFFPPTWTGITPMLSILKHALRERSVLHGTLIWCNRSEEEIFFRDEVINDVIQRKRECDCVWEK